MEATESAHNDPNLAVALGYWSGVIAGMAMTAAILLVALA
jgi:hypothetical protein